uniref:Uncharacterized protein n=1 Tax=Heterorhabditis bacteriophora TaxID=37862 RepID=A0A1I7WXC4_HETBA
MLFKDFLIVALDLLSGMAESLSTQIEPLLGRSNIMQLISLCSM